MRTTTPEEIGRVARQRRVDMGLSQDELAERAGVTRQWLSRFEQAKSDSSMSKVMVVLRELELSVDIRNPEQPGTSVSVPTIRFPLIDPDMLTKLNAAAEAAIRPAVNETTRLALERLAASSNFANLVPDFTTRMKDMFPDMSALSNLVRIDTALSAAEALPATEKPGSEEAV